MNKFWRFILIGLGRFDFEAEEKAKKAQALKTRPLLKLTTQHHHEVYKRLCDEAREKSAIVIDKWKAEIESNSSTCPACGSKSIVDKIVYAGKATKAINRCKACENEWDKSWSCTEVPNIEDLLRRARITFQFLALERLDIINQDSNESYLKNWDGIPLPVFEHLIQENGRVSNLLTRYYLKNFNVKFMQNMGITELEEAGYDVGSNN